MRLRLDRIAIFLLALLTIFAFFYVTINGIIDLIKDDEPVAEEKSFESSFVVTGDTTPYDTVNLNAQVGDTYDYTELLKEVRSELNGDLVFTNLDTAVSNDNDVYTGYPTFNSPVKLIDDLVTSGFNLFSLAHNQSLDQGVAGARTMSEYFTNNHSTKLVSGLKQSCDDFGVTTFENNGIKYAYLAVTTNVVKSEADNGCTVNIIDDEFTVALEKLNEAGSVAIVSLHYGEEDKQEISESDQALIDSLINHGVEIILGHGPHVLRKIEEKKNSDDNDAVIFYSLGNFLHSQIGDPQRVGGIANFSVKLEKDKVKIENVTFIPTYLDFQWTEDREIEKRFDLKIIKLSSVAKYYNDERETELSHYVTNVIDEKYLEVEE